MEKSPEEYERRTVGRGLWILVRPDGVDVGVLVPTALGATQATDVVRTLQGISRLSRAALRAYRLRSR